MGQRFSVFPVVSGRDMGHISGVVSVGLAKDCLYDHCCFGECERSNAKMERRCPVIGPSLES